MNRDKLIIVDTETGGLDPDVHPIWQIAWATWNGEQWTEGSLLIEHDYGSIDPWVIDNTSYRRHFPPKMGDTIHQAQAGAVNLGRALRWFTEEAKGRHIVGMVPSFDEERLRRGCLRYGITPSWHYHMIDVETLIVAHHPDLPLPWKSDDLCRLIGVEPDYFERHDALGDVRLNIACLEALGVLS